MNNRTYVLVTPARNEQATIGITIQSVLSQTVRPVEWVIVSDGSTDRTDAIVQGYAADHPFIRLLRLEARPARNFASVVFATESGLAHLQTKDYEFLGLLDADVRFGPDYFATLLQRFAELPRLGLAGGHVLDVIDGKRPWQKQSWQEVAGAVQLFRRKCFESLGGLVALPEGGWDAITNFQVRAQGYETRTFPDLVVDHLKPRNAAEGGMFRRNWQLGVRDYALGYDAIFETAKCAGRWREPPMIVSSLARCAGFFWSTLSRRHRVLPAALVAQIRGEQRNRLLFRSTKRAEPADW